MEDCIFCKIASGQIPCQKIWEDENYLAFLDIHPESEGHTLIIPKKHFRWIWDVSDFAGYMEKVKEVALLLKEKYKAEWILMKVLGVDIPHAHVHLVPHEAKLDIEKTKFEKVLSDIKKEN